MPARAADTRSHSRLAASISDIVANSSAVRYFRQSGFLVFRLDRFMLIMVGDYMPHVNPSFIIEITICLLVSGVSFAFGLPERNLQGFVIVLGGCVAFGVALAMSITLWLGPL